jgi:hypothetical protein
MTEKEKQAIRAAQPFSEDDFVRQTPSDFM